MNKPYVICHMVQSIDGKVTGEFLSKPQCEEATEVYYEINRSLKSNGFICGRITMEGSFTGGWYPDLTEYEPAEKSNYIPTKLSGFYAVSFDPKGKLGWKAPFIEDEDPGYDRAQVFEVLTEQADPRYLGYLKSLGIPYIFAGKHKIDVMSALKTLSDLGVEKLLLEGGSIINGTFLRANAIDELSLVIAPLAADENSKPLFDNGVIQDYELISTDKKNNTLWLRYKKKQ